MDFLSRISVRLKRRCLLQTVGALIFLVLYLFASLVLIITTASSKQQKQFMFFSLFLLSRNDMEQLKIISPHLSFLFCIHNTHYTIPPFQQGRSIPANMYHFVEDAWNGYKLVPLREEDHHLLTLFT